MPMNRIVILLIESGCALTEAMTVLVLISQNKGTESENSYQKLKRSLKDRHTETVSNYFDGHGRLSQSEEGIFVVYSQTFALF